MTYEKIDVKDETSGHENNSEYYIGSDGKYYVLDSGEYKEISPSYISGASLTLTGDISVNLYEENEQKADICNTVRALYKYNQAVKAYFG